MRLANKVFFSRLFCFVFQQIEETELEVTFPLSLLPISLHIVVVVVLLFPVLLLLLTLLPRLLHSSFSVFPFSTSISTSHFFLLFFLFFLFFLSSSFSLLYLDFNFPFLFFFFFFILSFSFSLLYLDFNFPFLFSCLLPRSSLSPFYFPFIHLFPPPFLLLRSLPNPLLPTLPFLADLLSFPSSSFTSFHYFSHFLYRHQFSFSSLLFLPLFRPFSFFQPFVLHSFPSLHLIC